MKLRYAIVRVDNRCPVAVEDDIDFIDRIKMFPCFNDNRIGCKNCRYGDTKEQLIKKVAQSLKGTLWNDKKGLTYEEIAKKIIEFLGVE